MREAKPKEVYGNRLLIRWNKIKDQTENFEMMQPTFNQKKEG